MRDPVVDDDEALLGETLASRFDWLWNHDLQQDLNLAYSRLGWKAPLAA